MTETRERAGAPAWNRWRIARWAAALALLLTPLAMMQVSDEWDWKPGTFLLAGILIGGVGLLYDFVERANDSRAYRAGFAFVLVTAFLTVWTTIVRDDGNGIGSFLLVMAAVVGGFSAWFGAAGLARTMVGVAMMQAVLGVAIATQPATASQPDALSRTLLWSGVLTAFWLISAACFRVAAKRAGKATASLQG
jgi:hypothetical protein